MPARGPGDFGWDAVFEYEGKTYVSINTLFMRCIVSRFIRVLTGWMGRYAEMDKATKNQISHRGKALEKLATWIKEHEA